MKKVYPTEEAEQRSVVAWLDLHRILYHHSPNGGSRPKVMNKQGRWYSPASQRLKAMGTQPGFPDLLVFPVRVVSYGERGGPWHGVPIPGVPSVAIEMKRLAGRSHPTSEQEAWLGFLGQCGWVTMVAYGAEEAIKFLKSWGYGI